MLFITGLCGQKCFYCPVNEAKYGHDLVYANEWKLANPDDPKELLEEARLCNAKGAGITGGDPLCNIKRCAEYIVLLKKTFGKLFHIHLYTPLKLVTQERLKALFDAGLDEIRFHPDLDDETFWKRMDLALAYDWKIGVEIPAVPGYEEKTRRMIDFIASKVSFLNLNELELSDTAAAHYKLTSMGYKPVDDVSYGVKGSKEMALSMLEYARNKGLVGHYCTAKLKDKVQVGKRIALRAKNVALPYDKRTPEGTLVRGVVYLASFKPDVGYREKLKTVDAAVVGKSLEVLKGKLLGLGIKADNLNLDMVKYRVIVPPGIIRSHATRIKKLGYVPAIVEEYPTFDAFEVEIEFF